MTATLTDLQRDTLALLADTFVAADRRLLTAARFEGLSVADVAA